MIDRHLRSSTCTTSALHAVPPDALLARVLLGVLGVAAIAVLSLPQARAASATFGWLPLWLLATPLSAWLALQARRHLVSPESEATPARHRRRFVAAPARRRATIGPRGKRHRILADHAG